jgi:3-oxoacyl-[acyl-carrier-protein] synthase II
VSLETRRTEAITLASARQPSQRVVITGLGVVACCGVGKEAFWRSVRDGVSGISRIDLFDTSNLTTKIGGQIRGFDPLDYIEAKKARHQGRFVHYAIAAAREAYADAELEQCTTDRARMGVAFGSSGAGYGNIADDLSRQFVLNGVDAVHHSAMNEVPAHAATSHIAIELGFRGPTTSASTGCVTAMVTMAQAVNALHSGAAKVMLAGASEASLGPLILGLLCRQRVMSKCNDTPARAVKPFDKLRDGLVLGDGSGAVVLETADHAMDRGAHIYAELLGYGMTCEAYHMLLTAPAGGEELGRAFRAAMMMARVHPGEIDHISAHGIGNQQYDVIDTGGIKAALGDHAYRIPVSSIKAVTAQPFSASGAMQTVAACMTLQTDTVPPTINYTTPDEECDLDYVPNVARRVRVDTIMMNAHSFGGSHAAHILRRFEE